MAAVTILRNAATWLSMVKPTVRIVTSVTKPMKPIRELAKSAVLRSKPPTLIFSDKTNIRVHRKPAWVSPPSAWRNPTQSSAKGVATSVSIPWNKLGTSTAVSPSSTAAQPKMAQCRWINYRWFGTNFADSMSDWRNPVRDRVDRQSRVGRDGGVWASRLGRCDGRRLAPLWGGLARERRCRESPNIVNCWDQNRWLKSAWYPG